MPRRSSIYDLPDDLRDDLNAKLVGGAFSNYRELEEWLNAELESRELELRVSKSAIHRHGQQFEAKLERMRMATERARAIAEGARDDEGSLNEAIIRMIQVENIEFLERLDELDLPPEKQAQLIGKLNTGIAKVVNASVGSKKWHVEARERAAKALERVREEGQRAGISAETLSFIEQEILGVAQ